MSANPFAWTITVLSNSGCQIRFLPLRTQTGTENIDLHETLWDDADGFKERQALLKDINITEDYWPWSPITNCNFIKWHLAWKEYNNTPILGIEVAIETAATKAGYLDWGVFFMKRSVDEHKKNDPQHASIYHNVKDGEVFPEDDIIEIAPFGNEYPTIDLQIGFRETTRQKPLSTHLVIDLGNTRTCALLLKEEQTGLLEDLAAIPSHCKPVMLNLSAGYEAITKKDLDNVNNGIVSSWIMLHETEFNQKEAWENFEKAKYTKNDSPLLFQKKYNTAQGTKFFGLKKYTYNDTEELRLPIMFSKYSPVIMGKDLDRNLKLKPVLKMIQQGLQIQQSSPKRYYTAETPTKVDWCMVPNNHEAVNSDLVANKLEGNLFLMTNEYGKYVNREKWESHYLPIRNPRHPQYPRSTTFVWLLLAILERAWEQCNRGEYDGNYFVPYVLKDVILTHPSGWTKEQIDCFNERCAEAITIFEKTNFASARSIKLHTNIDESVASQIPLVFSEINKFQRNAGTWMKIMGKERGEKLSLRVMNFDIGGGTSDISIVEYQTLNNEGDDSISLKPTLIFRDGFSMAGDGLLKKIISDVILPAIKEKNEKLGQALLEYFTGSAHSDLDRIQKVVALKTILIPAGIKLLTDIGEKKANGVLVDDKGIIPYLNEHFMKKLNEAPLGSGTKFKYDIKVLDKIISDFFKDTFEKLADFALQYDIDLFSLSGKTSELPQIMELAKKYIPLTLDRILQTKDYRPGDWYPFLELSTKKDSREKVIKDAKSITAVGAALTFLLQNNQINGWEMEPTEISTEFSGEWGYYQAYQSGSEKAAFDFVNDEASIKLKAGSAIARCVVNRETASPIYCLQRKDYGEIDPKEKFQARIRRERDSQTGAEYLDLLELISETDGNNYIDDYCLGLFTENNLFWQDEGHI